MHSALNTDFTYNGVTYPAGSDAEQIALGDNFLSKIVPEIEASQAYKNNGMIVIWNDETEGDEDVGSTAGFEGTEIIISPLAKGNAYTNNILYTHSSDLVTLQNIFGVAGGGAGGYLGASGDANSLSDLFKPGAIPSAVPEPSTWVMMGLGFAGLAGAAAYRRKAGVTAKPAVAVLNANLKPAVVKGPAASRPFFCPHERKSRRREGIGMFTRMIIAAACCTSMK